MCRVDSALLVGRGEELVGALVRLERLDRVRVVRDVGLAADQRLVLVLGDAADLHLWRDRKEKAHAARVACRRRARRAAVCVSSALSRRHGE